MKKMTTFLVALGVLFVGAFMLNNTADARPGIPGCPGYGTYAGDSPLTEEQHKKLTGLFEEQRKAVEPIRQKLIEKKAELNLATVSEKIDSAKIAAISKEIGELRGQLLASRLTFDEKLASEGFANFRGFGHHRGDHGYMRDGSNRGPGMGCGGGAGYGPGHRGYGHGMGHGMGYGGR